jgi:WhiB family transcriptional regulator, redox-sensing transcriptional regulator
MTTPQTIITDPNAPATLASGWMANGLCRELDPSVFFPSDGVGVDHARRICATCPVQEPCLEYALVQRIEHGVWGGASERERRRILKRRRVELTLG